MAAFAGTCAILFNAFVTQGRAPSVALLEEGSTRVVMAADHKASRTITLKYDPLVEDIQRELLATGHFNGLVDGVTGPKTKVAIEAYQRENKIDVTGNVTKGLLEHIQYTRKLNLAAEFTGAVSPVDVAPKKPQRTLAPVVAKAKPVAAENGDKAIIRLQTRLAKLGYDPGSRSGQLDEGTRSAILIFEMDYGLPMQGKISEVLLSTLKSVESKQAAKP